MLYYRQLRYDYDKALEISGDTAAEGFPEGAVQRLEIDQGAKNIKTDKFEIAHTFLPIWNFIP